MCAPRFAQVFEWISNSWNNLSSEIIIKSFTECGIGATVTGSFHNYLKEALENGNYLFYNFFNAYRHFYIIIKFNLSRVWKWKLDRGRKWWGNRRFRFFKVIFKISTREAVDRFYFSKNLNHLVHNEEIKSKYSHAILKFLAFQNFCIPNQTKSTRFRLGLTRVEFSYLCYKYIKEKNVSRILWLVIC